MTWETLYSTIGKVVLTLLIITIISIIIMIACVVGDLLKYRLEDDTRTIIGLSLLVIISGIIFYFIYTSL